MPSNRDQEALRRLIEDVLAHQERSEDREKTLRKIRRYDPSFVDPKAPSQENQPQSSPREKTDPQTWNKDHAFTSPQGSGSEGEKRRREEKHRRRDPKNRFTPHSKVPGAPRRTDRTPKDKPQQ